MLVVAFSLSTRAVGRVIDKHRHGEEHRGDGERRRVPQRRDATECAESEASEAADAGRDIECAGEEQVFKNTKKNKTNTQKSAMARSQCFKKTKKQNEHA